MASTTMTERYSFDKYPRLELCKQQQQQQQQQQVGADNRRHAFRGLHLFELSK
jgi:hypothetical protein